MQGFIAAGLVMVWGTYGISVQVLHTVSWSMVQ